MKLFIIFIIEKLKSLLKLKTVFFIPENVCISENFVIDTDLDKSVKLNDVACNILSLIDGKNTVEDIVSILLKKYNVSKEILERDINIIVSNLQNKNLVECKIVGNKILVFFFNLAIGQYVQKKRYSIAKSKIATFLLLFYIVVKKLFIMWLITIMPVYFFINNFTLDSNYRINYAIGCYFVFIFSMIFGFVLHEWIHIAVSKIQNQETHGYILAKRFTVSIVKVNAESSLLSILLGPLIPSILGIIFIFISLKTQSMMTFLLGIGFVINIINLLPFTKDGKGILEKILMKKLMKGAIK